MSLQAPRRRRGRRTLAKPKNQEFARDKVKAGTSDRTTHANIEALDGRYGATSNLAYEASEDHHEEPGSKWSPSLPTVGAKFGRAVEGGSESQVEPPPNTCPCMIGTNSKLACTMGEPNKAYAPRPGPHDPCPMACAPRPSIELNNVQASIKPNKV